MTKVFTKRILSSIIILVTLLFLFWFFYLKDLRDHKLMREGENISLLVEEFKNKNNRLPENLREINLPETEAGPLYYEKLSDSYYVIYYNTGFDETDSYYSDTKKWEDGFRPRPGKEEKY